MANGPLVFIITHLITFPLYNHVWLQHTSLYVKMLSDIPTFNLLSIILKLTLISLFTMTQLKCIEYWSFLHTNYCFVCHWFFFNLQIDQTTYFNQTWHKTFILATIAILVIKVSLNDWSIFSMASFRFLKSKYPFPQTTWKKSIMYRINVFIKLL